MILTPAWHNNAIVGTIKKSTSTREMIRPAIICLTVASLPGA